MNVEILFSGILIFIARIFDVSIGTVRTIATVQGRTLIAFFLGLIEVTIWISVISKVVNSINSTPILIIFYAFGYATGNVVGILVERKMALGFMILRVVTRTAGKSMADRLRNQGQRVTAFTGEGLKGTVTELYIVCWRKEMKSLISIITEEDPDAFYITEQAMSVNKVLQPIVQPVTGWRSVFKKK
ncbi:MAG: DUF2179 domain-containing protein [Desulfobacterales bacterium]|nr:DUF2179 domain-containing protein [Desulfobacterales bacterium]